MIDQTKYRETAGMMATAIQIRVYQSDSKIASVVCVKDNDCWVFLWTKENRNELLKTFGYLAADPNNGFDDWDAAKMTAVVRHIDPTENEVWELGTQVVDFGSDCDSPLSVWGEAAKKQIKSCEDITTPEEFKDAYGKKPWKPKTDSPKKFVRNWDWDTEKQKFTKE